MTLQKLAVAQWLVLLGLALTTAHADTLETIRQRGVLVWGADAEGAGRTSIPDDDPTEVGFEVELADLLASDWA